MKKIKVEICACNRCVMMGAMEIRESVESLKKLKDHMEGNQVEVIMEKRICKDLGDNVAPVVSIEGNVMTKATAQTVMEQILNLAQGK